MPAQGAVELASVVDPTAGYVPKEAYLCPLMAIPPHSSYRGPRILLTWTHRHGQAVIVDGETLSIPAVAAVARYGAGVVLDDTPEIQDRVLASRKVIADKVNGQKSVYGVSTGFGGSGEPILFHIIARVLTAILSASRHTNQRPSDARSRTLPAPAHRCPALRH